MVYVVVGEMSGIVENVEVFSNEKEAVARREALESREGRPLSPEHGGLVAIHTCDLTVDVRAQINNTEAGKRLWKVLMDLAISSELSKEGALGFLSRQFTAAITDVWAELGKLKV